MSKYQTEINEIREQMIADGFEIDFSVAMDTAQAVLFDPEFKKLAKKEFPFAKTDFQLQECVANTLA